ncbi:MAG TPA: ABC transporter permease, partial [Ohtaekwangia sp.]|uniref:ABC transporter permease n=1 Tax=Ohtaekwangia sp. TaxID=2066019 RepID=UPI002F91CF87
MKTVKPPRLADKIFAWYCDPIYTEDLCGDLEEIFYNDLENMPVYKAKLEYWQRILSLLFSYAIKKRKQRSAHHYYSYSSFHPAMLKNYFLIATRNLAKHKFFTIINALGLAVGMSIGLLLIAMLSFLWTYDAFHVNKDRIYRVISITDNNVKVRALATAPSAIAQNLKDNYTGIEKVVRINNSLSAEAHYLNKAIPLQGYYADDNFLQVFTFPLLKGNVAQALVKPNTMVMTEEAATKMFGEEDAIGKVIEMGGHDFEITGLLKNYSKNSHMEFEVLASYQTLLSSATTEQLNNWVEFPGSYIYILFPEQHNVSDIESYLNTVATKQYANNKDFSARFELQALTDIAPGRELRYQIGPEWDYLSIGIFIVLTAMILLPACFNYANISISRALKRMKEIGLRKVMGGQRNQIFLQFITETVIITLLALILSYYIFLTAREQFLLMLADRTGLDLSMNLRTMLYFVLFALAVGIIAGIIPAVYFSKLTPIQALRTKPVSKGISRLSLRKALIVGQFALSLGFIMSVVIVLSQYRHTLNHNFGFDQENILDVPLQGADPQVFRNEFSKLTSVQSISMSSDVVGASGLESIWVKDGERTDSSEVSQMFIDEKYINNMKLSLLAGSNFSEDIAQNRKHIIVNEEFLKAFAIKDVASAIGESFILPEGEEVVVAGVVRNFHYMPLTEPIRSFFFRYDASRFQYANIKMIITDVFASITQMESAWKLFAGEKKFEAKFFDDEIREAYSFYFSMIKICGAL